MTPIRLPSLVRLPDGTTSALGPPPPDRFQRYDHALAHSAEHRVDTPTPSINTDLVFRRGGFASLCDALDYAAHGESWLFCHAVVEPILHVTASLRGGSA